jgi:hypothetical protein
VESSCEFDIEPSGSMKCWETSIGLSSSAQLHRVSYVNVLYAVGELMLFYRIFDVKETKCSGLMQGPFRLCRVSVIDPFASEVSVEKLI